MSKISEEEEYIHSRIIKVGEKVSQLLEYEV